MDEREFDAWYAAAYPRLSAQLAALIGDRAEAADCVQEAFIRAWDRRGSLRAADSPDAWIRTTAYRLAVSRWRRLRRGTELGAQTLASAPLEPSPERVDLIDALAKLPLPQRHVVVLHYLADRSVAQIAVELRVAEGTVKARLHRARAALATQLRESTPDLTGERP